MIVLKANDTTTLSFEMAIEGAANKVGNVCLVLETNKGFDLRFPAEFVNGVVSSNIPMLENVIDSGEYTLSLEVNVDGKVYTPLQESVTIEVPIQVKAKLAESVEVKEEIQEAPVFKTGSLSRAILKETTNIKNL